MGEKFMYCPTVMLVEDFADLGVKMKAMLELNGCRVVEEPSVHDALEVAADFTRRERPALILLNLDRTMPDEISALGLLREETGIGQVPIVALEDGDGTASHTQVAGCNECVTKPEDDAQLTTLLDDLLPKYLKAAA